MAGSKLQSQISGFAGRTQQTDQFFEDGIAVARLLGETEKDEQDGFCDWQGAHRSSLWVTAPMESG